MVQESNRNHTREKNTLLIAWGIALLALLIALFIVDTFRPVTVSFIDVGQGDSCLIQAGKGGNVLIDGGDKSTGDILVSYFESRNVNKLDAVFLSHFHEDHVTGILELLDQNFPIDCFYISKHQSYTALEDDLVSRAKERGIPIFRLCNDDEITLGKATYHVIGLEPYRTENDINNMSMVLRMSYGASSVLFTGDLETKAARSLLAKSELEIKSTILKVPHHGGISSFSAELLSACKPEYAVICVGENYYGNPSNEVLTALSERNIPVYRTDRDGAIVFTLWKKGIRNLSYTPKRR